MDKLISQQAAIDALKDLTANGTNKGMVFGEDAVHRIEILPSVQPNHCAEVGKKVLIDRQEALEAIGTLQTYKLFAGDDMLLIDQAEAQTELMMLPPAKPEITTYGSNVVKKGGNDEDRTTDDLISRQQAIMAIEQHRIAVLEGHKWDEGIEYGYAAAHRHLVDIIEQLPSAQPEIIRCKDCINYIDHRCTVADHHVAPFSCCQSVCGAKMKAGGKNDR